MRRCSHWPRRCSRKAVVMLRFCVSLCLALQIIYTPIHLAAEPHSNELDAQPPAAAPIAPALAAQKDGDHGHHEPHSALQHKLNVVRSQRPPAPLMVLALAPMPVEIATDCPLPQVMVFSGLSPPELPRSWQFVFRAALPVRAPSVLS